MVWDDLHSLTVSNFTPKPHTPFQWHTVSSAEFDRKHELLRDAFKAANLYGVKFNITPQKISAMEDFIGRGDRRLGRVIKKAWENGAENDAWWFNTDEAHAAWGRAIAECGLDWKYREMENGEWNVLEKLGDKRYRKQGGGGKGRIDRGALADERLKAPLPWDHINTGISKTWLATDLQKALEEATVPDCAHSGLCSECGVCGDEFGDNVVAEVPEIPSFKGHYEPDHRRTQRMRVRFGKHDTMVYIGHLDLVHVFERALRRAAIPVSQDNSPYHSRPRINVAMPLSLGATSDSEILEVELTEKMPVAEFTERLAEQLPSDLPLFDVEAVEAIRLNGAVAESAAALLSGIEWYIAVTVTPSTSVVAVPTEEVSQEEVDRVDVEASQQGTPSAPAIPDFEEMMAQISANTLAAEEVVIEKVSKKKKKLRRVDVRPLLEDIRACSASEAAATPLGIYHQPEHNTLVLYVKGVAQGQAQSMTPELTMKMLEKASGGEWAFEVVALHRHRITLREQTRIKPNHIWLKNLVRKEGFIALNNKFGTKLDETRRPPAKGLGH